MYISHLLIVILYKSYHSIKIKHILTNVFGFIEKNMKYFNVNTIKII